MAKTHERLVPLLLLLLLVGIIAGVVFTRAPEPDSVPGHRHRSELEKHLYLDQQPLQTAQQLAALAGSRREKRMATDAVRLADHELDVAFTSALRQATDNPSAKSPEAKEAWSRIKQLQSAVRAGQDGVKRLTRQVDQAKDPEKDLLEQQLEVAQAQLHLTQDELDDAKEDLARSGGDVGSRIQRLMDEHEAAEHANATATGAQSQASPVVDSGSLVGEVTAGYQIRNKLKMIEQAQADAVEKGKALGELHQQTEKQVQQDKQPNSPQQPPNQAAASSAMASLATAASNAGAAAAIAELKRLSDDQRNLSDLDKRIQDQQDLNDVYGKWILVAKSQREATIHSVLVSLFWIVLIVLITVIVSLVMDRFFLDLPAEKKRLWSLRVVLRFTVQIIAVLLIAFIVLGKPSQLTTIIGLAGAGLTIALKDFIVGFFGWFVLMGRNGIRVGDWVEINGVGGEVVEIGLLRTVLLETGNWTDSGHPTGRRVAFVNSYAIEGHFFNFSTSGQWLWDELQVLIPGGQNPYPVIEEIQKIVSGETENNAHLAQQEWLRVTRRYGVQSLSAAPAIDVRPTGGGVQVIVRYITHAHERYEVRARLYQAIVGLLHGKSAIANDKALAGKPQ